MRRCTQGRASFHVWLKFLFIASHSYYFLSRFSFLMLRLMVISNTNDIKLQLIFFNYVCSSFIHIYLYYILKFTRYIIITLHYYFKRVSSCLIFYFDFIFSVQLERLIICKTFPPIFFFFIESIFFHGFVMLMHHY